MDGGNARELADPPRRSAARIIAQGIRLILASALMIFATADIEARTDQLGPRSSFVSRTSPITTQSINLSRSCMGCHQIDAIYNHPVEIVPSEPPPSDLPLVGGVMTCTTCHLHRVLDNRHGRDPRGRYWLRGQGEPSRLCVRCHDAHSTAADQQHAVNLGKAHLHWKDRRGGHLDQRRPNPDGGIDQESISCLSCHDGLAVTAVGEHSVSSRLVSPFRRHASHPVGVDYEAAARRRDGMPLVPTMKLESRIRLVKGQVGCGSCHSPYSHRDKGLVLASTNSRLCLGCHKY